MTTSMMGASINSAILVPKCGTIHNMRTDPSRKPATNTRANRVRQPSAPAWKTPYLPCALSRLLWNSLDRSSMLSGRPDQAVERAPALAGCLLRAIDFVASTKRIGAMIAPPAISQSVGVSRVVFSTRAMGAT